MKRLVARVGNFLRPSRAERELAREVAAHLALIEEDYRRRGLPPDEARLAAKRAFGGVEQAKERHREERSIMWLDELRQDFRYAVRTLRRTPGFTLSAVLTLALGIGAATAILSVADRSLLDPVPFPAPDRLVTVNEVVPVISNQPIRMTAPDMVDFQAQTHSFVALGGWVPRDLELSGGHESERVAAARLTASMFGVLQVQPVLGRAFTAREDRDGAHVCVISNGLWQRWFGADPGAIGRTVDLDRVPYEVIGVMPRGFTFPLTVTDGTALTDVWVPMSLTPAERQARLDNWDYNGLARMKPGVTAAQASADVAAVARRIVSSLPAAAADTHLRFTAVVQPFGVRVSGPVRPLVLMLLGAVALLLLIACVNVANLLLARGTSRGRELTMRGALGATRRRLLQQLVIETLCLAGISACLGLALAWAGTAALAPLVPTRFALLGQAHLNWRVLLAALALTVLAAVLVGTIPGLAATSRLRVDSLKDRGAGAGVRHRRLRSGLVVAEVALAVVLLVGAGLLARSFSDLLKTPAGFEPEGAVAGFVSLPALGYPTPARERRFQRDLLDRLRAMPGVEFAGVGATLPLEGRRVERAFTPGKYTPPPGAKLNIAGMTGVSGTYLQAIGATLVRGRYFTPQDDDTAPPVAIVTQSVARQFWPGQNPLGNQLKFGRADDAIPWLTIVGVVDDVKQDALDAPAAPQIFVPDAQLASTIPAAYQSEYIPMMLRSMFVVVRGHRAPEALIGAVRAGVHALDARLAVAALQSLTQTVAASAAPQRFNMLLMLGFAALALLLAAIGVYGVVAYAVAQRTQEIGIRMALGADAGSVVRMVLGGGLRLGALGVGIGLLGAAVLTPLMRALLFGVKPLDLPTFAGAAAVLLAIATVATYVPARRAARVDPQTALRSE